MKNSLSLILIDSLRSRAYIQNLLKSDIKINNVLIFGPKNLKNYIDKEITYYDVSFNPCIEVAESLELFGIKSTRINVYSINSKNIYNYLINNPDYYIYSGMPGEIVSNKILTIKNISFIHSHPGFLPNYRGSTTIYFSVLNELKLSASLFIMDEKIDNGELIYRSYYQLPQTMTDFDHYIDPLLRSKCLIDGLNNNERVRSKIYEKSYEFYIIHPVLKKIAINKALKMVFK